MPYVPEPTATIFQRMVARLQARSGLKDVQGGVGHTLYAVAEEMNGFGILLKRFRDLFFFVPSGTDAASDAEINDRTNDLPPGFKKQQQAVPASGDVLQVSRAATDVADTLTIAAGSVFGHKNNPNLLYQTSKSYSMGVNVASLSDIRVTCLTVGEAGNTQAGTITRPVSASPRLVSVSNTKPLTNGVALESISQVIARVFKFLAGLARSQRQALEYCALSFTATDGTRAKFAKFYEDLKRPGYGELIIDDGSGMQGMTRPGAIASGIVPTSGILRLWHEAPATQPLQQVKVTLANGGGDILLQVDPNGDAQFLSVPERGIVELFDATLLSPGDLWKIEDYEVFTGLIADLQFEIEGDPSSNKAGWRAATTRARVLPPTVQTVAMALHVVPVTGFALDDLKPIVLNDVLAYVATLAPGDPLFVSALIAALMKNPNLQNVRIYALGSVPLTPLDDVYPLSLKYVLRADSAQIQIIPSPEA